MRRRSWERWPISSSWSTRRAGTAWTWRSTSHFNARPTILTSKSIPSGFGIGRTARFNMPRILRRNIRIFIRSISSRKIGKACGSNCMTYSSAGCERGVRIFRVDNPHTKAFGFWQWCIGKIKQQYPDALFLSEAFTRPKLMYRLAKLGFSQSYTYFTWRYGKQEFVDYLTELTHGPVREFFRPNLWPNTPDILPEHLQQGNRAAFIARYVLAATLSSNTGIYGPPTNCSKHKPRDPGSEEYLDSEKYEIRSWDLERTDSLCEVHRGGEPGQAPESGVATDQ